MVDDPTQTATSGPACPTGGCAVPGTGRALALHLLRGAVGFGAGAAAIAMAGTEPLGFLALMAVALAAFKGCPMCWLAGFSSLRAKG
jgi:hypothetical protein